MGTESHLKVSKNEDEIRIESSEIRFCYTLRQGVYAVAWLRDGNEPTENIGFEFRYGRRYYDQEAVLGLHTDVEIKENKDAFGTGVTLSLGREFGEIYIRQNFWFYEDKTFYLTNLSLEGNDIIQTNYLAPLSAKVPVRSKARLFSVKNAKDPRVLYVPFDNDMWTRFCAQRTQDCGGSYEVTAIFDDASRHGYVIGSIEHDAWKTGIETHGNYGFVTSVLVYGGAASAKTRDSRGGHGNVCGKCVTSPKMFVGYYEDIRSGLTDYGNANTIICPPLEWDGGTPFGFNSFAGLAGRISYAAYEKTSDVMLELENLGFKNRDAVYVNFDGDWFLLSDEELRKAVELVHKRGQKAGIYFTPFACCWLKDFDKEVPYTNGKYVYRDILLRDEDGNILPTVSGSYPVDPTHPGNIMRVEGTMRYFSELGFDYLKTDFMSHGACEGVHYLSDITTGIQAYNYGLSHMLGILKECNKEKPFFVDFSIAPIFPYQYAHARRISCDAFGEIEDTEYMLNAMTYGFWENGTIYRYTDPDHVVLYQSFDKPVISENEANARLLAAVISGTVLLLSDDYQNEEAVERTKKMLRPEYLELARDGEAFWPVEMAVGDGASSKFVREKENVIYLAIFNYSRGKRTIPVDVKRISTKLGAGALFVSADGKRRYDGLEFEIPLEEMEAVLLSCRVDNDVARG